METDRGRVERGGNARGRYGGRTCLFTFLVLLAFLYLGLRGLGAFLITGDRLRNADAVVPLGGGGDWRVLEAVRLIEERGAGTLILTEPGEIIPGTGMGSEHFRQVAVENGISPYAIIVTEDVQRSTHDEAEAVLRLMEQHKFESVVVITDPFHTQRARMIFRQVFDGSGKTVRVHPVQSHWYRSGTWFLSLEGWQHTLLEYAKIAGFKLGFYETLD